MEEITEYELLMSAGAVIRSYEKGVIIVKEGGIAKFYFHVVTGEVKMVNTGDNGQEFIQGLFKPGESFAEPPLFLGSKYPASAIAITDCELLVLEKSKLLTLLSGDSGMQMTIIKTLCKRLYFKAMMAREISLHDAGHRILTLIDFLKEREGRPDELYEVTLTRQQIANLTGLRVETVIRAVGLLTKKALIQKGRRLYR